MSAAAEVAAPVHSVTLGNGVVVTDQMSALERSNAVAKAMGAPVVARPSGPVFGPRFDDGRQAQTDGTVSRMNAGDVAASVDRKSVDAVNKAFGALAPKDRTTHRHAYEADLKALFEGQRSPGNLSTALDKAARDTRVQTELNKALAENKSPAELQAILDGALSDKPRDASGRYVATAPPQGTPAERGQFTPAQWETGHASVVNAGGFIPLDRINKDGLSGYTLPRFIADQHYVANVFTLLANARAAGMTQAQVDAWIAKDMRADGLIK